VQHLGHVLDHPERVREVGLHLGDLRRVRMPASIRHRQTRAHLLEHHEQLAVSVVHAATVTPPARDPVRGFPQTERSSYPFRSNPSPPSRSGSSTRKVVPRPGSEEALASPPCALVTAATIARPRPAPPLARARDGSAR